jgi:threonine/homoserine/homoserine lactone efflux protein
VTLPEIFITSFTITFSGAMMPGPVLSATIHQTAKHGAWAGVLITVGHAVLELALMVGLFFGLEKLLKDQKTALAIVGIVGGLMLLFMAAGMSRYRPQAIEAETGGPRGGFRLEPVVAGFVTSLSNPYWIGWWLTIGLSYVTISYSQGLMGLLVFYAAHELADLAWYATVGFALAKGRRFAGGTVFKWLVRACAVFMAVMGVIFLVHGIRFFSA